MARFVRLVTRATEMEGSTRSVGLLRLCWGLILWARWADELTTLLSDPDQLKEMADNARHRGVASSAERIVDDLRLLSGNGGCI